MKTRRQKLLSILKSDYHTVQSIAKEVGAPVHVVLDDLKHVEKSLGKSLVCFAATCETCEFTFENGRITKPSKCPKCRKKWISGPILHVEE